MNKDIFKGKTKQWTGDLKSWWSRLSDDDIKKIGGSKDKLIDMLHERYGYSRDKARAEVEQRIGSREEHEEPVTR